MIKQESNRKAPPDLNQRIINALEAWNERDNNLSLRRRVITLVLVSALGLFFELVLIRLLGAEIKVFAFLKNVVLVAAFLGLGLGFMLSARRIQWLPLFLPGAVFTLATVAIGVQLGVWTQTVLPGGDDLVLLGLKFQERDAVPALLRVLTWVPYYGVTLFYFLLVVLVFIPLGQYTGKSMQSFPPLLAYSLNLIGALAGTALFVIVSFAWLPPAVWMGIVALAVLALATTFPKWLWRVNVAGACLLLLLQIVPGDAIWSPYNKLVVLPLFDRDLQGNSFQWGYQLRVGEYYYQDLADLSPEFFAAHPNVPLEYRYSEYEVPYAFASPEQVLILGAGTGDDVAAAIRHNAKRVDAVDIDPGIIEIGKRLHPEQPYATNKVTPHVNDARAFLKGTDAQYDLVLFGLLDSQQVLSAFGSVRLDNFVYTVEGMRDAYSRVKPDGMLVVTFELFQPWIGERMALVLQEATGQIPLVLHAHHGTVFLVRKSGPLSNQEIADGLARLGGVVTPVDLPTTGVSLTTDDWPYLYLRDRGIPFAYVSMLPLVALVSIAIARRVIGKQLRIQWRFFLLGAAFLLMEVRIIAQVALLFGSTWLVNAAAIAAVLLMAILANLLIARLRVDNIRPWAVLLIITLIASSLTPAALFLSLGQTVGGLTAALHLALPIFFAGMVFSGSLRQVSTVESAMASNLLGSILGGLVEYISLILGIGSLAWLALLLYALALAAPLRKE